MDFCEAQKAELGQTDGPSTSGLYPEKQIFKFQWKDF